MPYQGVVAILNDVWDAVTHAFRVEPAAGSFPVTGTVTANQGTPNAGGANAWEVQGGTPIGSNVTSNPFAIGVYGGSGLQSLVATLIPPATPMGAGNVALIVAAAEYACNGVNWSARRVPVLAKTAAATAAGSTALWTPATGKSVRLQRYRISVTGNAAQAVAGVLTISLLDAAAGTGQVHDLFVPGAALSTAGSLYDSGWIDLGNGVLSAAANNVLNINLSAALSTGNVRVIACGTEE